MIEQDIFVGVVAVLTGLFVMASALLNSKWINRFWISRHLESASNGIVSRAFVIGLGVICSVLGVLLILGFFPGDSAQQKVPSDNASQGNQLVPTP